MNSNSIFDHGIKLSELVKDGSSFTIDMDYDEINFEDQEFDFMSHPDVETFKLHFEKSFTELKAMMTEICDGVWKKTYKESPQNATLVEFTSQRVTYHRNFYMENENYPFDSTHLNARPAVICNDAHNYLEGLLDALGSMKEGENAYFIISYKKMFGEKGCPPRVMPQADILCDLSVLKVEEIGDEKYIQDLNEEKIFKTFNEVKTLTEETRLRAKDLFKQKKYKQAVRMYKQLLNALKFCDNPSENEKKELDILNVEVMTNIVTCFNVLEKPKDALAFIQQIEQLSCIETNAKVLFAKAKALRLYGNLKEAKAALISALKLLPNNDDIHAELLKLNAALNTDKQMWKNILI